MIDILFAIVILLAIFKGFTNGLIVALFSMVAFIVGIAAALKLSVAVAHYVQQSTSFSGKWLPVLSFLLVFIMVAIAIHFSARLIEKTFELAMLGWLNKLGGVILYCLIYTLIFSVFLFYADKIKLFDPAATAASKTFVWVQPLGPKVIDGFGSLLPFFKGMFEQLESFFEGVSHKIPH